MSQRKVKAKTLKVKKIISTRRKNNFEVEKVGRKSSVILNHVN